MILTRKGTLGTVAILAFAAAARLTVAFAQDDTKIDLGELDKDLSAMRNIWQHGLDSSVKTVTDSSRELMQCGEENECLPVLRRCKTAMDSLEASMRVHAYGEAKYNALPPVLRKILMGNDIKLMHASGVEMRKATAEAIRNIQQSTGNRPCFWPDAPPQPGQ